MFLVELYQLLHLFSTSWEETGKRKDSNIYATHVYPSVGRSCPPIHKTNIVTLGYQMRDFQNMEVQEH